MAITIKIKRTTSPGFNNFFKGLSDAQINLKAALIAEQIFVDMSPVDTGLLRANWLVGHAETGRPIKRTTHVPSKTGPRKVLYIRNVINYVAFANIKSFRPNFLEKSENKFRNVLNRISLGKLTGES